MLDNTTKTDKRFILPENEMCSLVLRTALAKTMQVSKTISSSSRWRFQTHARQWGTEIYNKTPFGCERFLSNPGCSYLPLNYGIL